MFNPKTVGMGARAFDSTTATLREYFGMDVDDTTVEYYAKQGFFHATNQHDMRVQVQTALDMLEFLLANLQKLYRNAGTTLYT